MQRVLKNRISHNFHRRHGAAQFQPRTRQVVGAGDEDHRAVVVAAHPVGGFSGVADGVLGHPSEVDAAIDFFGLARHDVLQRYGRHVGMYAGDQQPHALALVEQPVGDGDAVGSAGQRDDAVRHGHIGGRCAVKLGGEEKEAARIGDREQRRKARPDADDAPASVVSRRVAGPHARIHLHRSRRFVLCAGRCCRRFVEGGSLAYPPGTKVWQAGHREALEGVLRACVRGCA